MLSNCIETVTFIPLSISPPPENVTSSVIEKPFAEVPLSAPAKVIPAEPDTSKAPANAEVAIRELPSAVKPIFLMFILITPLINC